MKMYKVLFVAVVVMVAALISCGDSGGGVIPGVPGNYDADELDAFKSRAVKSETEAQTLINWATQNLPALLQQIDQEYTFKDEQVSYAFEIDDDGSLLLHDGDYNEGSTFKKDGKTKDTTWKDFLTKYAALTEAEFDISYEEVTGTTDIKDYVWNSKTSKMEYIPYASATATIDGSAYYSVESNRAFGETLGLGYDLFNIKDLNDKLNGDKTGYLYDSKRDYVYKNRKLDDNVVISSNYEKTFKITKSSIRNRQEEDKDGIPVVDKETNIPKYVNGWITGTIEISGSKDSERTLINVGVEKADKAADDKYEDVKYEGNSSEEYTVVIALTIDNGDMGGKFLWSIAHTATDEQYNDRAVESSSGWSCSDIEVWGNSGDKPLFVIRSNSSYNPSVLANVQLPINLSTDTRK